MDFTSYSLLCNIVKYTRDDGSQLLSPPPYLPTSLPPNLPTSLPLYLPTSLSPYLTASLYEARARVWSVYPDCDCLLQ